MHPALKRRMHSQSQSTCINRLINRCGRQHCSEGQRQFGRLHILEAGCEPGNRKLLSLN
jgi:hypothetical protein